MEEIYKNILLMVHSLTQLSGTSYAFSEDPTEAKAEKIVEVVDKCEDKFLKVKEEIVKMISEVENSQKVEESNEDIEIKAVLTDKGYLIKE
jgi:hypothetical protein